MNSVVEEENTAAALTLPPAPAEEAGPVKAWHEAIAIRTYQPAEPDPNPLFLEKRVYQGSSGRVYPLPVIDRIETTSVVKLWDAVHIENEYIRIMILPEIGGRIHVGLDKRNGYDFFYRQNVIKPALVGLAGPWISGGVEFNWPQHHRPATFMPVEVEIEREADGSVTVWCSDHDPMARMKGMHGIRIRPGRTYLEVRVRLYNRTMDTQTFLWWANVATRVHEQYQSFFPKDVRIAADHAKRATTAFPLSFGKYYGVDYGERAQSGIPPEEAPAHFVPDGSYPANDLSWYANIPVPTSYMIAGSKGDFAGGYDHSRNTGLVYFADHHIAPGKKQWTWGNHEFGYAWDRSLTDTDGPYIELMAGAYTDNQPDFSFLAPGETKTFSQYWYPIRSMGVPDIASLDAAVHVTRKDEGLQVSAEVTRPIKNAVIRIGQGGRELDRWEGTLSPAQPFSFHIDGGTDATMIEVFLEEDAEVILRYAPAEIVAAESPQVATEPPLPQDISSIEELYLTGVHLEQYRHPTRYPEAYWHEALQRDANDSRVCNALGRWHLRRGEFAIAEELLRRSIARLTTRNPNPYDGEPLYNLGLALAYQGKTDEAYDRFYKATWNAAWRSTAYHRLAEIDCQRGQWAVAQSHIKRSLSGDVENLNARNLKVIVLRNRDETTEATSILKETLALDPLDIFARYLHGGSVPQDGQQRIDLALDLKRCGKLEDALKVAEAPSPTPLDGTQPILRYVAAHLLRMLGRVADAEEAARVATEASPKYVYPSRLEEMVLLEEALSINPEDAQAAYYLGNFFYDRKRHQEGIAHWERAAELNPAYPTVWRNLGFGYFNIRRDAELALRAFQRASELAPDDARIFYEFDQLLKRTGSPLEERLKRMESHPKLVKRRDDLSVELASLLSSLNRPSEALHVLLDRHFQPWEGGEGQVLTQYMRAHLLLAQECLRGGDAAQALNHLNAADAPPETLSEAKHLLMNRSHIDYFAGIAERELGHHDAAAQRWNRAAHYRGDFQGMQAHAISPMTFWSVLSLKRLGEHAAAQELLARMNAYANQLREEEPKIDYFATSLPALLLFDEDLKQRQHLQADLLQAQILLGSEHGTKQGIAALDTILQCDRDYASALDLLRMFSS
jgi:tetratricopeptide (TPR) repeat protein